MRTLITITILALLCGCQEVSQTVIGIDKVLRAPMYSRIENREAYKQLPPSNWLQQQNQELRNMQQWQHQQETHWHNFMQETQQQPWQPYLYKVTPPNPIYIP